MWIERRSADPASRSRELRLSSDPVQLGGASRLSLSARIGFRLVESSSGREPWDAEIVAYRYTLQDHEGKEIVPYHWHPEGRVTTLHFHLGAGAAEGRLRPDLATAHLPSGYISLQAVLRLVIVELGVRPIRPDWDAVLRQTQQAGDSGPDPRAVR